MRVLTHMITLYCRKKHHHTPGLCPECEALLAYAHLRTKRCPFTKTKTFCAQCKVHCYAPAMRARIREVMRFSGPRLLLSHPMLVIRHMIDTRKQKEASL